MNMSLRRVAVAIMSLVVLLLVNATVTQVFRADGLRNDPRNQRVLLNEYSRQRGQITAGGQLLAYSVATNSPYRFLREYPNPFSYAHVTGFYSLRFSSTGLERAEDTILNGSDPRLLRRQLADFVTGRDPRGGNVTTTLVPNIQNSAWEAMQQGCHGPCTGAVVALEPATGKILAMVSTPSYDPNLLASHNADVQGQAWNQLRDDPAAPLTNRAITQRYPPGSTFKVITTAAALTAGISEDYQLTAQPRILLPDSTSSVENYNGTTCGEAPTVSLREAFARSCNTAFVQLGMQLGADALRSTAQAFGFDSPGQRIPLAVTTSTVGPLNDAAAVGMSSMGQKDVTITPLHNAQVAATIANSGLLMQPFLVDARTDPALSDIDTTTTQAQQQVISPDIATKLTDLMIDSEKYTQQQGALPGVRIASKTGTAEHGIDPRNTAPHTWYIAFAPAENPQVAVSVFIENGGDRLSATGGSLAAPIGRATIAAALAGAS